MSTQLPEPERVESLWFEDADVIFQAGQKLFRVHRSLLSARSPIFKDMFALPPPSTDTEVSSVDDKCAHIYLPDDEWDVHRFFLAIFDSSFFEAPPSKPGIRVIIAILHLSSKYEVAFLKRRAVSHLDQLFPTTASGWILTKPLRSAFRISPGQGNACFLLTLLTLVRAVGIRWVIPGIFSNIPHVFWDDITSYSTWSALPEDAKNKFICHNADYTRLKNMCAYWIINLPAKSCSQSRLCARTARELYQATLVHGAGWTAESLLWNKSISTQPWKDFCPQCISYAKSAALKAVQELWDNIPEILDLPDWATLESEKKSFYTKKLSSE